MAKRDADYKKMKPEEVGYLGAAINALQKDNPYPEDTEEFAAWDWGWREYKKDHSI